MGGLHRWLCDKSTNTYPSAAINRGSSMPIFPDAINLGYLVFKISASIDSSDLVSSLFTTSTHLLYVQFSLSCLLITLKAKICLKNVIVCPIYSSKKRKPLLRGLVRHFESENVFMRCEFDIQSLTLKMVLH